MRPPKIQRSPLRYPLDRVLGSAALVRVLRVIIFEVGGPVGVTDAARLAGLSVGGARNALEALEGAGIVERVGTGRAQKYGLSEGNPYSAMLAELFQREQSAYDDLLRGVRQAVAMPEVTDAWMREVAESDGRTLELDVIVETAAFSWIGPEMRTRLIETEAEFGVVIEVNVFTRADDVTIPVDATLLWGAGIVAESSRLAGRGSDIDSSARSLRLAQAIADLIKSDPSLVQRALRHTDRLLHEDQGMANRDIGEWRQLLEAYSPEQLRSLLVSNSSRAERLRRSSPFFAILTSEERDRLVGRLESQP
ncbi:MAG: winged helix-turn-helix transcriptional regulator [Coriobacteriia bacterium]|nr:winged helix-turn-helix transcriptional regulator [Coriobacteriia bacterium]